MITVYLQRAITISAVGFLALALCACDSCSKKTDAATSPAPEPAVQIQPLQIKKLRLTGDAPSEATVLDAGEGQTVMGGNVFAAVATTTMKLTQSKAKGEYQKYYSAKNLREEVLPDGYAIQFENSGPAGTNYWVQVQRVIGAKIVNCSGCNSTLDQQKGTLAFCKSLRSAK